MAGEGWGDGEGLVGAGLGDVQLAWDFVTASEDSQLGTLRAMRESSMSRLDAVLSAEWEAPASPVPVPPARRRRLRSLDAAAADGDVEHFRGKDNYRDRESGGDENGSSRKSGGREARSGRDTGGGGGGDGDGEGDDRRRTAAPDEEGSLPPAVPLYRVVKVEQSAGYSNGDGGDNGAADDAAGDHFNTEHPAIVRTVWGRMRVPAFVSPSARGAGLVGGWEAAAASAAAPDSSGGGTEQEGQDTTAAAAAAATATATATTLEAGFVVRVPRCVALGRRRPSAVVQYGHGLFGDRSEVEDGFLDLLAERGAWVLVAADWRGMSRIDLTVVARGLVSRPELLVSGTAEDLMQVGGAGVLFLSFFFKDGVRF